MLEIIQKISPETCSQIIAHLKERKERLESDHSSYARGREKYWLEHSWNLKERRFHKAIHDERLWVFLKRLWPKADLGLVVHGSVGIKPHRDDSYADYEARALNLGTLASWQYDCQYPNYCWTRETNPSNPINYQINMGDFFRFNCKNPHAAIEPSPDRWGIFLWEISPKMRAQFAREKNERELSQAEKDDLIENSLSIY